MISFEILFYIVLILIAVVIILFLAVMNFHSKLKKILRGSSLSLDESIGNLGKEVDSLQAFKEKLEPYLSGVEKRLKRSFQGHHTVRFNPFKGDGSGGLQSFATAFLNEEGNGVIISSLYSRERMSIYAKPVKQFETEFELTTEEKEALSKAKESCKL